jgi:hypothetical protein
MELNLKMAKRGKLAFESISRGKLAFESISAFSDNGENQGYIFLLESVENIR